MVNEVIIGEIVVTVIAVGLPLILNFVFKWSRRHGMEISRKQEEYIINAATNGAIDVWNKFTSDRKRYSIDGKLTEEEKNKARRDAIQFAKTIAATEFRKAYKRGDVDRLIIGAMEKAYANLKKEKEKENSSEMNANKDVLEAVNMALKISMKKYMSYLKKSINEGKFEEVKTKEIVREVAEISKNFMNKKIVERIDGDMAESKDRLNKIIMKEMYKIMLSEEAPKIP